MAKQRTTKGKRAKADSGNHRQQLREQGYVIRDLLDDNDSLRGRLQVIQQERHRAARRAAGKALMTLGNAMEVLHKYCRAYRAEDEVLDAMSLAGEGLLLLAADNQGRGGVNLQF